MSLLNQVLRHENNSASINEKLDQILEFLQTHTQNPYDPLVLYSFDGVQKRVISTDKGQQDVTFGGTAADAFKQMAEFQTRRDWSSLLTLCQKEIDEEHGWATPFLFCSVAHINTGTLDIAEEELRKAKNIVHDSPDYADAIRDVNRGLEEARKRAH